jgi:hypothetical protein
MPEHSPEPWKVEPSDDYDDRFEIDHSGNGSVAGCDGLFEADARRIVACVNELRDIPIEVIESGAVGDLFRGLMRIPIEIHPPSVKGE